MSFNSAFSTLVFVRKGSVRVAGEEFDDVTVGVDKMFVIPSKTDHHVEALVPTELVRLYIIGKNLDFCTRIVSEQKMAEYANKSTTGMRICPLHMADPVKVLIEQMVGYIHDQLLCCDIHTLKQRELSAVIQAYYDTDRLRKFLLPLYRANSAFQEKVIALQDSYLNIDQMAERLYMSRSTFIRRFTQQFKESPMVWMTKNRCKALYKALSETETPLEEVSRQLKFSSQQGMSAFCKKNLGGTPMQVRNGQVAYMGA